MLRGRRRGLRRARSAVVMAAALLPLVVIAVPGASAARRAPAGTPGIAAAAASAAGPCASAADSALARRLGTGIRAALRGRAGRVSVAVYDHKHRLNCGIGSSRRFDSASVIKVTILGATLRRAIERRRPLSAREKSLAHKMITRSDNAAASALWRSVGRDRLRRFVRLAGMTRTKLGPDGYWGLSQITARDQLRLLGKLTRHNTVLTDRARRYALRLMNDVIRAQRWGTPAGAPPGARVHVKNGWLPRNTRGWRVHSIGAFGGGGRNYMIVVLSDGNASMTYGIRTIERVARAVHRDLNPGRRSMDAASAPHPTWEISDGSVPPSVAGF